jgi:hypothetical protein
MVHRVQTGIRMERGILKVLKALAEYHDMSLGDLVEGIVLHAFDGTPAFERKGRARILELKRIYGLKLNASHSHRLVEAPQPGDVTRARRSPARRARPRT